VRPELPSDPEPQFVHTAAGRLAFTVEGAGQGTVLAVPGLPGTRRDFRWLAPLLAQHCRVVRVDLPGFGDTPRFGCRGWSSEAKAEVLAALIDALELERVSLLSHSSGSAPAVRLAAGQPERVDGLVLLAPTGSRPHYPTHVFAALAAAYRVPLTRGLLDVGVARFFASAGFPRSLTDEERRNAVLDAAALDFAEHRAALVEVAVPALVCWAEDDPVIPADIPAALVWMLANAEPLTFTSGGHNIQKTQARAVADAVVARCVPVDAAGD
jgi:pimeloyl-ACP methyl ester carboxylesterase